MYSTSLGLGQQKSQWDPHTPDNSSKLSKVVCKDQLNICLVTCSRLKGGYVACRNWTNSMKRWISCIIIFVSRRVSMTQLQFTTILLILYALIIIPKIWVLGIGEFLIIRSLICTNCLDLINCAREVQFNYSLITICYLDFDAL